MAGVSDLLRAFRLKRARRHWSALPGFIARAGHDDLAEIGAQAKTMEKLVARVKTSLAKRYADVHAQLPDAPPRSEEQHVPGPWLMRVSPCRVFPGRGQTRLGEVELFHDGQICEVTCQQAVFEDELGVDIDALGFDGSYVSMVLQTPAGFRENLTRSTLIGATIDARDETNAPLHLRLNVRHGPNIERMVREVEVNRGRQMIEFDIFHTDVEPSDISEVWLDLILNNVRMNRFVIRGVQIFRRPRAHV